MRFDPPLRAAVLLRRYKRFLADIRLPDGSELTIHCPNTGSMLNCQDAGSRIWFSTSNNPNRKYVHTWEMVETKAGHLVGINTSRANNLVMEAVQGGKIAELQGYLQTRAEVSYGDERSRIDLLLTAHPSAANCYVEVKNVSLSVGAGMGVFPDAVTTRGHKHMRELMKIASEGYRALLLFCVQHSGIDRVAPADAIDPEYGRLLRLAEANGVQLLAYGISLSAEEFVLTRPLPVVFPEGSGNSFNKPVLAGAFHPP